jgi:hypothetical protein
MKDPQLASRFARMEEAVEMVHADLIFSHVSGP